AVYPEYTRPVPALSLVQIELDPEQGKVSTGFEVPQGTILYSRPVGGVQCRFRTCFPTTLWPIRIAEAAWTRPARLEPPVHGSEAVAALRLRLQSPPDVP